MGVLGRARDAIAAQADSSASASSCARGANGGARSRCRPTDQ